MVETVSSELERCLAPTPHFDFDCAMIQSFVDDTTRGIFGDVKKAVALYYAVRDEIIYDPYLFPLEAEHYRASQTLESGAGFCVPKAILLTAAARAAGIPAQIGFANVRNHLCTKRLSELMETDLFVWHGYSVLYLEGHWVKATPTFNIDLCRRFKVKPLDFDGRSDAIMHPFNEDNQMHMEYLDDHGWFTEFPAQRFLDNIEKSYPKFCAFIKDKRSGSFHTEQIN